MARILRRDTANSRPVFELGIVMIPGTNLERGAERTLRRAVVTLAPKRRFKDNRAAELIAPTPTVAASPLPRPIRMKRTGRIHVQWRGMPVNTDRQLAIIPAETANLIDAFNKLARAQESAA